MTSVLSSNVIYSLGSINLPVVLGERWKSLKTDILFIVAHTPISWNINLGRITIKPNKIISYKVKQKIKLLPLNRNGEISGDQPALRSSYVNCPRRNKQRETLIVEIEVDPSE